MVKLRMFSHLALELTFLFPTHIMVKYAKNEDNIMKFHTKSLALVLFAALTAACLFSGCVSYPTPGATPPASGLQTAPSSTAPSTCPTTAETTPTTVETTPVATVPPTTAPAATEPSTQPTFPCPDDLTASHAFLYRCSDEDFLFLKGSMYDRIYPASITKLFTAYVALQHLEPEQEITVGNAIDTVPPDSSLAFLSVGDVLTVEDLIHGMLLPSGGDAARVIAAEVGRVIFRKGDISDPDAIAVFIEEMNRQAVAVGMTGTHYVTPDGFHDPDHYTTMTDLLLLAKISLDQPLIRRVASTTEYTVTLAGRSATWRNTNLLLHPSSPHPEFYRETAIGLKTGFTIPAGRCLLSAFIIDGETVLAGVFGCPDPNWGFIAQFENICCLYDTYLAP